jgi:hypothetical protein
MRIDPLALKLVQGGTEGVFLNISQHHPHVCSSECARQGKSHATGRTGYERTLSLKFAHVLPP